MGMRSFINVSIYIQVSDTLSDTASGMSSDSVHGRGGTIKETVLLNNIRGEHLITKLLITNCRHYTGARRSSAVGCSVMEQGVTGLLPLSGPTKLFLHQAIVPQLV